MIFWGNYEKEKFNFYKIDIFGNCYIFGTENKVLEQTSNSLIITIFWINLIVLFIIIGLIILRKIIFCHILVSLLDFFLPVHRPGSENAEALLMETAKLDDVNCQLSLKDREVSQLLVELQQAR